MFIALYSQEVIIVSQFMVFDGNTSDIRYLTAISTQYVNKFWRNGIIASIKEIFALIKFLKRDKSFHLLTATLFIRLINLSINIDLISYLFNHK